MGLRKISDVSTISRALSQMGSDGVQNVRQLSRSLVTEGVKRERLPRLTFDFDGSVQSTNANTRANRLKASLNFTMEEDLKRVSLAMPKPMGAIVSLLQDDWLVTKYIPFLL